jgi:hypothetical protein
LFAGKSWVGSSARGRDGVEKLPAAAHSENDRSRAQVNTVATKDHPKALMKLLQELGSQLLDVFAEKIPFKCDHPVNFIIINLKLATIFVHLRELFRFDFLEPLDRSIPRSTDVPCVPAVITQTRGCYLNEDFHNLTPLCRAHLLCSRPINS